MIHLTDAALTGLTIRPETPADVDAREELLDAAFGPARHAKTCERLREGRLPALALAAHRGGRLVGTVRLWNVSAGPGRSALMLGPLAVDPGARSEGLGGKLMRAALSLSAAAGRGAVLLVGDAPYYERFGFSAALTQGLWLPGPVERERFLGLELVPGALTGARGLVSPTGERAPTPDLGALVAAAFAHDDAQARRAA
ncbi:GNAT family N-acetyltransferase [Alsobacter sp. SYSU BS001988]